MARCRTLISLLTLSLTASLAACGSDSSGPDDDVVTIEMRTGNTFNPATRTITAGTTVRWVNEDAIIHNTTSQTAGLWSSGNIQPDATFQRTFPTAGTFPYSCTIHPGMNGTITVQ